MRAFRLWLANRSIEDDLQVMLWIVVIAAMILFGALWRAMPEILNPSHCGCLGGGGDNAPARPGNSDMDG